MLDSVQSANYLWLYILPHTDPFINTAKGNQRQGRCVLRCTDTVLLLPIPSAGCSARWIDNITVTLEAALLSSRARQTRTKPALPYMYMDSRGPD